MKVAVYSFQEQIRQRQTVKDHLVQRFKVSTNIDIISHKTFELFSNLSFFARMYFNLNSVFVSIVAFKIAIITNMILQL